MSKVETRTACIHAKIDPEEYRAFRVFLLSQGVTIQDWLIAQVRAAMTPERNEGETHE